MLMKRRMENLQFHISSAKPKTTVSRRVVEYTTRRRILGMMTQRMRSSAIRFFHVWTLFLLIEQVVQLSLLQETRSVGSTIPALQNMCVMISPSSQPTWLEMIFPSFPLLEDLFAHLVKELAPLTLSSLMGACEFLSVITHSTCPNHQSTSILV